MILLHFAILLGAIAIGARVGGIAIGFAGGAGVLVLGLFGLTPGALPLDVVSFIMVVIVAVAAMQVAGGMDYLVDVADRILRANPKNIALLAPFVTYMLTFTASTGQASFSTMPVIVEVAKENNVRPQRALAVSVAASLLAITASPISAAVLFLSTMLEQKKTGWDYLELIAVSVPATFFAVMTTALLFMLWDKARGNTELSTLPVYQERLAAGLVQAPKPHQARQLPPGARRSVVIFLVGLAVVLGYAILISDKFQLVQNPVMNGAQARLSTMLAVALAICMLCKTDVAKIPSASTFKIGMTACVCILGVAWLGTTFMKAHEPWIQLVAGDFLRTYPWMLAVVLVFASALLYSQAATTKALMPTALAIGLPGSALVACFPATSALFILPNYPTLLAAVELDDTGSTKLGHRIVDHPFVIPGLVATGLSVLFSFGLAALVN